MRREQSTRKINKKLIHVKKRGDNKNTGQNVKTCFLTVTMMAQLGKV